MDTRELHELRKSGQPLYAKNLTKTIITANDETGRFELGAVGSPDSVKPIPAEKLNLSGVQALVRAGKLEIGTGEMFDGEFVDLDENVSKKNIEGTGLDVTIEEDRSKKDLVEKTCLITGKPVFQTMEQVRNDVPPLHESVADKAREFVVRHTPKEDGGHDVTWDRVQIG